MKRTALLFATTRRPGFWPEARPWRPPRSAPEEQAFLSAEAELFCRGGRDSYHADDFDPVAAGCEKELLGL